jgi:hypothetical protein
MKNEDNQKIVERFFEAIQTLKKKKKIKGLQTFTTKYNINNRNIWQLKQDPCRKIFDACWLTYLVLDYDISAYWLLTGQGEMFTQITDCKDEHKATLSVFA